MEFKTVLLLPASIDADYDVQCLEESLCGAGRARVSEDRQYIEIHSNEVCSSLEFLSLIADWI